MIVILVKESNSINNDNADKINDADNDMNNDYDKEDGNKNHDVDINKREVFSHTSSTSRKCLMKSVFHDCCRYFGILLVNIPIHLNELFFILYLYCYHFSFTMLTFPHLHSHKNTVIVER